MVFLFQGDIAYESKEYDEPLPGWSGHWNSQQDKQHEQFRVRQPQQKLSKHNMYAKAATFSTTFYCEQVRLFSWTIPVQPWTCLNAALEIWFLSIRAKLESCFVCSCLLAINFQAASNTQSSWGLQAKFCFWLLNFYCCSFKVGDVSHESPKFSFETYLRFEGMCIWFKTVHVKVWEEERQDLKAQ